MIPLRDLCWLAGLLEGEGSFMPGEPSNANAPRISLAMTDSDVVHRAAALLGVHSVYAYTRRKGCRTSYQLALRGARAAEVMQLLHPLMGARRKSQIERALATYSPLRQRHQHPRLGEQQVLEIYRRAWNGEPMACIARDMGVSYDTVQNIKRGRSWSWLTAHADNVHGSLVVVGDNPASTQQDAHGR